MAEKRLILIIFNTIELQHQPGSHWILAAVNPLMQTVTIYNSLNGESDPQEDDRVNSIAKFFTYRLLRHFYVVYARVNQQQNNYDCGCFGKLKVNFCIQN